jgi:hypothetical protein
LSGEVAGLSTDIRLIAALLRRAGFDDGSAIASLSASVIDSSKGGSSNVQQRATTGAGADGGNGSIIVRTPTRLDPQDVNRLSPPAMLLHGSAKAAAVAAAESTSHPHGATGSAKHAPRVVILEASHAYSASLSTSPTRSMPPGNGDAAHHSHRKVGFKTRASRNLRPSSPSADIAVASSSCASLSPEIAMTSLSIATGARRLNADIGRLDYDATAFDAAVLR